MHIYIYTYIYTYIMCVRHLSYMIESCCTFSSPKKKDVINRRRIIYQYFCVGMGVAHEKRTEERGQGKQCERMGERG